MAAQRLRDLDLAVQPSLNTLSQRDTKLLRLARTEVSKRSRLNTAIFVNFVDREQLSLPPNGNVITSTLIIHNDNSGVPATEFHDNASNLIHDHVSALTNDHDLLLKHDHASTLTLKTIVACAIGVASILGVVWMGFKLGQQTRIIYDLLPHGNDIQKTVKEVARKCIQPS